MYPAVARGGSGVVVGTRGALQGAAIAIGASGERVALGGGGGGGGHGGGGRHAGRGLHSFPFPLNLSFSVHRMTQLNS
jgi:hypothetical protein